MKINVPAPFVATYLPETPSTMDAVAGEPCDVDAWPLVLAGVQTQARGRLGRPWQSMSGNFLGSFMLPLEKDVDASTLSLLTGLAAQKALSSLAPNAKFHVKWPNDIVAQGKDGAWGKFGGILVETKGVGTSDFRAIVGIGLNLAHAPATLSNANPLLPRALCGEDIGTAISVPAMTEAFCVAFLPLFNTWKTAGFAGVREDYNGILWRLNEEVSISTLADKSDARVGINRGVDGGGVLQLETASGVEIVRVGE